MPTQLIYFDSDAYNERAAHYNRLAQHLDKLVKEVFKTDAIFLTTEEFRTFLINYPKRTDRTPYNSMIAGYGGDGSIYEVYNGSIRVIPSFLTTEQEAYKHYTQNQRQYDEYQILNAIATQLNLLRGGSFYGPLFVNAQDYVQKLITYNAATGFRVSLNLKNVQ